MRVIIILISALLSAAVFAEDSYLCVADKVTGFEFSNQSKLWEVAAISGDRHKYVVKPLSTGSERYNMGYRSVVQDLGNDGAEIAFCRLGSDVYGWLNCGEPSDPYKLNIRLETMRFIMTSNGSYLTSTREIFVEGQEVQVRKVPDKGGDAPIIAIGSCNPM